MSEEKKNGFPSFMGLIGNHVPTINPEDIKDKTQKAGVVIGNKAAEIRDSAMTVKSWRRIR